MDQLEHDNSGLFGEIIPIIHISDGEYIPIEFQIDKIWAMNSVGFISGQPGVYKSWLAWEIAVFIASGSKLFGLHDCKKGKVLAFNAEDDPAMVTRSRIEAIARQKNLDFKKLDLHLFDAPVIALDDFLEQDRIEATIQQYKPDLLIFDPLRNVHSLDEDNATQMSKLLRSLRYINRTYSCSIMLVCHDKKPSKDSGKNRPAQVRGSNALIGWRDNAIYLDKEKSEMIRVQIYNRACQPILPFHFTMKAENDSQGSPVTAKLVVTTQDQTKEQKETEDLQKIKEFIRKHNPMSKTEIAETLGGNRQSCLKRIKTLLDTDDEVVSQGGLIMIKVAD